METGTKVRLNPTQMASGELRKKVAALGDVIGEIAGKTGISVCTVVLPPGVNIEGHSHPLGTSGQHYIDLHQSHLQAVA